MQVFYCALSVYILNVLPLWKINFDMSAFDWLRINNWLISDWLTDLHSANFLNSLKQKITKSEPMNLPQFLSFSLPNPWILVSRWNIRRRVVELALSDVLGYSNISDDDSTGLSQNIIRHMVWCMEDLWWLVIWNPLALTFNIIARHSHKQELIR